MYYFLDFEDPLSNTTTIHNLQQQQPIQSSKEGKKKKKLKTNLACLPGRAAKAKVTKYKIDSLF